jgi:hypothetical protein
MMLLAAAGIGFTVAVASFPVGFKTKVLLFVIFGVSLVAILLFIASEFRKAYIRERLSEYQAEGWELLIECKRRANQNAGPLTEQVDDWLDRVECYVKEKLERVDYLRFHAAQPDTHTPFAAHSMSAPYWADYERVSAHIEVLKVLITEHRAS